MPKINKEKSAKDRKNVVRYVMKNPTATIRDIAQKLDVPSASVQRYIREYKEADAKDPRVTAILSKDVDIITKAQALIEEKLNDPEQVKRMKATELSALTTESARRYELLRWVEKESNETNVTNQAIQVNILFGDDKQVWATD